MTRIYLVAHLFFCLTAPCLFAGDFLKVEGVPQPTSINEEGVPDYTSYWSTNKGLPKECAQAIGEEGAQVYAEKMGWTKLLTAPDKGVLSRGFDQVWKDEHTDEVIVIDAKGRKLQTADDHRHWKLATGYGHTQTTIEWTIEVCKYLLESKTSSDKDREVARLVLQKIADGKLQTRIVTTIHYNGRPLETRTEMIVKDIPKEYSGLSPDQLRHIELKKGEHPKDFGDDPNKIEYAKDGKR